MFKKYRLAKGLTIKKTAELTQLDKKTIQNLENGVIPTVKTLAKLMNVLDIPGDEIIAYIKSNKKKRL